MKQMALAFLVTLAASVSASATPATAILPDVDIPYQKFVLPNGLTLIVHEDHKAPIVAVNIWYHVGSKDERPGRTGFAHLFEHLMFNGSEHHNDEYFRPLLPAGATKINGTTSYDRTNYYQNVPTSAFDLALWLESDRMGHLLGVIDQKKLDQQRGVVQNEKRQHENQPYGKASEVIAAHTYPAGHPYSWTTIGSMEDLNAAALADVKEWFRTYYGAANAVLVIAGDVQTEEIKRKVEHYFGDIAPGPVVKRTQSWVAKMSGEKRAMLQDRVPQHRIYKVWNTPGFSTHDAELLALAAQVLGGGKNSRLYKRLVHTDRSATDAGAFLGAYEIAGQFTVMATVQPGGDPAAVERALDEELARFLREGPTAEELERIKTHLYATFIRNLERIDGEGGKSSILAENQVFGGSADFYKQSLAWLRGATPARVAGAARRWLADGVFVLNVQPVPDYVTAGGGADRSTLPAVGATPDLKLPPLQRATLSNGLKIVLAERHNAPVVQMQLITDVGYAADAQARPGTAELTLSMLEEGTKKRDGFAIAARAEALGAQIGGGSSRDTSYYGLNALTSRLEASTELFADILLNPAFPQPELERLKAQFVAHIQQQKTSPGGIAHLLLPRLIYGADHPYAIPTLGTEVSVKATTSAELREFYRRWFRPDNATLLVVGDITLGEALPLLERHFGAWKAPAGPPPRKSLGQVAKQSAPRIFLVHRTAAEQSLIMGGAIAPQRADPHYTAMMAVNTMLGGSFLSRLNMNLRENKHWSYGVRTMLRDSQGGGLFAVSAPVQTDKTAESLAEIVKELKDLPGPRKPTAAEIAAARDSMVLTLPGNNETAEEVAHSYATVLTYGLPDSYWNDFVSEVNNLTPPELQTAAEKLIDPDAMTWLVVGDLAEIEAKVRALNLGQVTVLDAEGQRLITIAGCDAHPLSR